MKDIDEKIQAELVDALSYGEQALFTLLQTVLQKFPQRTPQELQVQSAAILSRFVSEGSATLILASGWANTKFEDVLDGGRAPGILSAPSNWIVPESSSTPHFWIGLTKKGRDTYYYGKKKLKF